MCYSSSVPYYVGSQRGDKANCFFYSSTKRATLFFNLKFLYCGVVHNLNGNHFICDNDNDIILIFR